MTRPPAAASAASTPGTPGASLPPPPPPTTTSSVKKQDTTFFPNYSDSERLIRVLVDFIDAVGPHNLNIKNDAKHYKLGEVLGGDLMFTWDEIVNEAGLRIQDADFTNNLNAFISLFLPSNAFLIQQEYMANATKTYHMNCFAAAGRLRLINILSVHLPGSGGTRLFPNKTSMKNSFFRLMLPTWQLKFNETGNQLDDLTFPLHRLVAFMGQQRLHHDANQVSWQSNRQSSYSNGNRNGSNGNGNGNGHHTNLPHYSSSSQYTYGNNNNTYRRPAYTPRTCDNSTQTS
eukprot:jgi/Psemu1/41236/gm1.41236_g